MTEQLENSLRIKVTGRCNRNCFFCHQEGGMDEISDITYSPALDRIIHILNREFNIQSIALTGGEPLLFFGLTDLVQSISEETPIKHFSLTTNGTIAKDKIFWELLQEFGLQKVNISMPDILNHVYSSSSNVEIFQNQLLTLEMLYELGLQVNINVVVYNDKKYLLNVLNTLFGSNIADEKLNVALLPDLTNSLTFSRSQKVIQEILEYLNCKKTRLSHRRGTSNTVCDYQTVDGHHLQVKTTKPNGTPKWLHSLCGNCEKKEECQEGFYGLRLENRDGELVLRMCLYRSDEEALLTIDDFLSSPIFSELKTLWG